MREESKPVQRDHIRPAQKNFPKLHVHVFQQGRRVWSQEGHREGQELDNRMSFYHIKLEPRTQTFKLHVHPSPLCAVDYVKLQSHWSSDESEKALSSVDITSFLVCVRVVHMFTCLLVHICLYMTYTNVILPNMRVETFLPSDANLMKRVYIPETRWCLEWTGDVLMSQEDIWTCVRKHENQPNNPVRSLFVGSSQRQWGDSLTHSSTHNGCGRARNRKVFALGSDLMWWQDILLSNSWPSLCPSCDNVVRPCFEKTFRRSWVSRRHML